MIKLKNLVILSVILILLGISFIVLKSQPSKSGTSNQNQSAIKLLQLDKTKIVKMVLSSENGDLTMEKKDANWTVASASVKLMQDTIDAISTSFASFNADKLVETAPKDLSIYGLDKPSHAAKAVLSDGTESVIYIGNVAPVGSLYYVMLKDKPEVYAVSESLIENFLKTLTDIRDKSLTAINSEELTYIKIAEVNKPVIEIKENPNQTKEQSDAGIGSLIMTEPYKETVTVDSSKLQTFLSSLSSIAIKSFVDDNPKDLSLYGLDKPRSNIIIKDKSNTLTLIIGKDSDENSVYFKTDSGSNVYTIDKSTLSSLKIVPFDVADKYAYYANIDSVSQVSIENQGKTDTLVISKTVKKAAKAGDADVTTYAFKLNGKELKEQDGENLYQNIVGLSVDGESSKQVSENPEIKMTFTLSSTPQKEVHVNYSPYNDDFYSIFKDGKSQFVISKSKLASLIDSLNKLK